jgi:hypothetical protein
VNVRALGREPARLFEVLGGALRLALPEVEEAEVGPRRRLVGREARGVLQPRLGARVVADLKRGEADVEGAHRLRVVRRGRVRNVRAPAGDEPGRNEREEKDERSTAPLVDEEAPALPDGMRRPLKLVGTHLLNLTGAGRRGLA